jgi:hypothetical protein
MILRMEHNLTTGQQLGPFVVGEITADKVQIIDASAANYRYQATSRWLKHSSPILAAIIARADRK